ncbi:uncharacterized protein LOC116181586 [Photinus pyralis]|uniref:uncharacterized protein LOC116181586 n=1 Tax=Photinus pyralis TaxID=7054 RepID=UPI0012675235|nr:uncharacterized protein LOC116181586 [Photinus pyralis]
MSELQELNVNVPSDEDLSDDSDADGNPPVQRKPAKYRVWRKQVVFDDAKEAEKCIEDEKIWKKITSYNSVDGLKVTFRCTGGQYRRNEFPAGRYLLYHSENMKIATSAKLLVRQLYNDGIKKPNAIIAAFRARKEQPPVKSQLKTFLTSLRSKTLGASTISAGELSNWCSANSNVPSNEDQPYVLDFKIDVDDADFLKQDLKIVLSTKRLLKLLGEVDKVQADATYKLVWQGYPVLIVGTSDICRKFHPLAVAVCFGEAEADFAFIFQAMKQSYMNIHQMIWKPNVLLADASVAITNGFKSVFGTPARRLQCFFHVLKNVDSVIRGITEKTEIGRDLHALQLCIDDEEKPKYPLKLKVFHLDKRGREGGQLQLKRH